MLTNKRVDYLDSMRFIAALCVFLNHFWASYGQHDFLPEWLWLSPLTFLIDGHAAVSIFFVLSGYVLVLGFFQPAPKPISLRNELFPFLAARIIRIFFPFAVALFISFLASKYALPKSESKLLESQPWLQQLFAVLRWPIVIPAIAIR